MEFDFNPLSYIYIEYTIAVVVLSEMIKKFIPTNIHPKWPPLVVGLILAGVGIFLRAIVIHEQVAFFKIITSYAMANVAYDYFWKPIKQKFFK